MALECLRAFCVFYRITPHLAKLWTDSPQATQLSTAGVKNALASLANLILNYLNLGNLSLYGGIFSIFLLIISTWWYKPSKRRAFWNGCFWWLMNDDRYKGGIAGPWVFPCFPCLWCHYPLMGTAHFSFLLMKMMVASQLHVDLQILLQDFLSYIHSCPWLAAVI